VQRRDGGVQPTGLDHRPHVAGEQRDEQAADVGAVDVGVGGDHDLAVAHLVEVERAAGAGADDLDDRRALGVAEHLRDARLLDVEDLAAQGQQRLELAVAGQLAGAEGAVALDEPQLGAADVGRAAVGELRRQGRGLERRLAPGRVLGRLGRLRVLAAAATFSSTTRACALRFLLSRNSVRSPRATTSRRSC
jgi:hypothetical protein